MDLFEWIGESVNPGSVGTVELGGEVTPSRASGGQVVLQLILAGALVGGALWVVFGPLGVARSSHNLAVTAAVLFSYLGLAWLIRPKPDLSNMGWAGGLIDHPFRYSDDINRSLLFFKLVLMPGLFVSECLVDAIAFPFGGRDRPRSGPARPARGEYRTRFQVRGTRGGRS